MTKKRELLVSVLDKPDRSDPDNELLVIGWKWSDGSWGDKVTLRRSDPRPLGVSELEAIIAKALIAYHESQCASS